MSRTLTAVHAIITDTCRGNRGDGYSWIEAVRRCAAEFEILRKIHLYGHGVKFHIKLEVELPETADCDAATGTADDAIPASVVDAIGRLLQKTKL